MSWGPADGGSTVGAAGSEGGFIVRDEEHSDGARITLEAVRGRPYSFAITCGGDPGFVHTRFFGDRAEADSEYERMKTELESLLALCPRDMADMAELRPALEAVKRFVRDFP